MSNADTARPGKIPCELLLRDMQWPSGAVVPTYRCGCGVKFDSIIRMSQDEAKVAYLTHRRITGGNVNADTGRMSESTPTPFEFTIGEPYGRDSYTKVGGQIVWHERGWLVSDGRTDYQGRPEQSKTEAVLEWLRLQLIDGT